MPVSIRTAASSLSSISSTVMERPTFRTTPIIASRNCCEVTSLLCRAASLNELADEDDILDMLERSADRKTNRSKREKVVNSQARRLWYRITYFYA